MVVEGGGMVEVVFAVGLGSLFVQHWLLEEWKELYVRMRIQG